MLEIQRVDVAVLNLKFLGQVASMLEIQEGFLYYSLKAEFLFSRKLQFLLIEDLNLIE